MTLILKTLAWLGLPSSLFPLILAGAASVALTFAYLKGYNNASAKCQEATLRTQIASLQRDIKAAKDAERLEAEEVAKLAKLLDDYEAEIAAYEIELDRRPDANCSLNDDDIKRLHGGGKR
jgi:septal ring factor EnvC (AmiA/AmiB activator)